MGRQEKVSDPKPVKTDIPVIGAMGTGVATGGSAATTGGQDSSFSTRLARVVPETMAALQRANADASARAGRPVNVLDQPEAIRAWLLAKYPDLTSDDANVAFEYLDWAAAQRAAGQDDSQAAYVRQQGWTANEAAPPNALEIALRGGGGSSYGRRSAPSLSGYGSGRTVPSLVG